MKYFPLIFAVFFLGLILLAIRKIRQSDGKISFTYIWGFLMGAFVWEDVFMISVYGFLASMITYFIGNMKLGILFFLIFWVVRSAGEALYFFLQQFFEPKHHPHNIENHFRLLKKLFKTINHQQGSIIMQVFFQSILMLSLVALVFLLRNW